MLNGFVNVAITKDLTKDIKESLKELASKNVCVGIPQEANTLDENGKITQAQKLYVHTHGVRDTEMQRAMQHDMDKGTPYSKAHELFVHENGSPLYNIPPRPILEPAIEDSKEEIAEEMSKVIEAGMEGKNVTPELHKVGFLAENAAKEWFKNPDNKWAANSPVTVKRKGSDQPLIDSGELREKITHVIREGDKDD